MKVTAILAVVVGAIAAFVLRSPTGHRLVDTHIDARDRGLTVASSVSLPALRASVNDTLEYFDVNVKPWHRASQALATSGTWQTVAVVAGDNMALIFSRLGLARGMLQAILDSGPEANRLRDIRPGQEVRFRVAGDQVLEMIHDIDLESMLHVVKEDSGFRSRLLVTEPDRRVATATATIEDSLFLAGQKAGISDNVLMQLVDIFGWDIDFLLDIRVGDSYAVVYEELFKDGKKVKDGRVLAAEFVNQNRRFRAVYFDDDGYDDYYADDGARMRKAFLRTPVNFTRISSNFNLQRRHPILNTIRAHRGVDYAAPHGTPVNATANGKVVSIGSSGGYGKTIKLQHGGSISTLYAHLSRFARGLKVGESIKQGQTIGYVGQTGLATGPHLHYEFLVSGSHRNPLTVELPKAEPIPASMLAEFRDRTNALFAQLDSLANQRAGASMLASRRQESTRIP